MTALDLDPVAPAAARRRVARTLGVTSLVLLLTLLLAAPALAYWRSSGLKSTHLTTARLARPTGITVPSNSGSSVLVSWTASSGAPAPTGYFVTRTTGGVATGACGTSASALTTAVSCTDTAVPEGAFTYRVVAVYRSWTATSLPSGAVTVFIATHLAFATQPSDVAAGVHMTPAITVTVRTASGGAVPIAGTAVTLALGTNPGGATMSGTLTALTNSSGVATFSDLSFDKPAGGYTVVASSTGLTSATSGAFTVSVGVTSALVFATSPSDAFVGRTFFTQPVTRFLDQAGNMVTSNTASVTLTLTTPAGAILSCTANPRAAVLGVATFSGCAVDTIGTYTLTASGNSLTAVSASFIVSAAPTNLAWNTYSSTVCATPPTGTSFAYVYYNCGVLGVGSFTSSISLTDSSGTVVTNLGADVTVTLVAAHGAVSATTLTIAHGQTVSSATSTFTPAWPLFVIVDRVTASAPSLTSAKADLHVLLV